MSIRTFSMIKSSVKIIAKKLTPKEKAGGLNVWCKSMQAMCALCLRSFEEDPFNPPYKAIINIAIHMPENLKCITESDTVLSFFAFLGVAGFFQWYAELLEMVSFAATPNDLDRCGAFIPSYLGNSSPIMGTSSLVHFSTLRGLDQHGESPSSIIPSNVGALRVGPSQIRH